MRRGVALLAGTVLLGGGALAGWLALGAAEPSGMGAGSLMARLTVPGAVRAAPVPERCGGAEVSRRWIECGGICGTIYALHVPSEASAQAIEAAMTAHRDAALPGHEVGVRAPDAPGCRSVTVEFVNEER